MEKMPCSISDGPQYDDELAELMECPRCKEIELLYKEGDEYNEYECLNCGHIEFGGYNG